MSFDTEKELEKALWQLHQQLQVAMKKAVARMLQIGAGLMITSSSDALLIAPTLQPCSSSDIRTASGFGAITTLSGFQQEANEPAPMEITLDQPFAG